MNDSEKSLLDRHSGVPLYRQVADLLRQRVESGIWEPGTSLPPVEEISSELEVRRQVVVRGLERLAAEGWVRADPRRRGWAAARPRPIQGVLMGWDPAELRPDVSGPVEVRVLSKALTTLPRETLKVFEVHGKEGHRANRIIKLYLGSEQPLAVEMVLSPVSALPGLLMQDHRKVNLFKMIRNHYRIPISRIEQRFRCGVLSHDEASFLNRPENHPAVHLTRIVFRENAALALSRWVIPYSGADWLDEARALPEFSSHIEKE